MVEDPSLIFKLRLSQDSNRNHLSIRNIRLIIFCCYKSSYRRGLTFNDGVLLYPTPMALFTKLVCVITPVVSSELSNLLGLSFSLVVITASLVIVSLSLGVMVILGLALNPVPPSSINTSAILPFEMVSTLNFTGGVPDPPKKECGISIISP